MSIVRVVYRADKSVAVIHPSPRSRRPNETEEVWLNRVFTKTMQPQFDKKGRQVNPLVGLPYDDIDKSELPQERENRNAWEGEKGKKVKVNAEKALKLKDRRLVDAELIKKPRQDVIDQLKAEGKIPADYTE